MINPRRAGRLIIGSFIGMAGMTAILAGAGTGIASASTPATVCSNPTSCVSGDPVLASVDVQSATAATLSGSAMSFGTILPGNTTTGTESYTIGSNDAAGAYVTATWDDSEIVASAVGQSPGAGLVNVPTISGNPANTVPPIPVAGMTERADHGMSSSTEPVVWQLMVPRFTMPWL
ncbi:MAG: hypothetical protein WBH47_24405 [Streptosporangiaceae bacterium]